MRAGLCIAALCCSACSLIANPLDRYTFDRPADGEDAGVGTDAAADSGPEDAGTPPGAPTLRFPWNGYRTGSALTGALPPPRNALRPRFMWEPVGDAVRYEIELSASCAPADRSACAFADAVTASTTETVWIPEDPLEVSMTPPLGSEFAWRVRACAGACGEWSDVRYVEVGRLPADFDGDGHGDLTVGAQDTDGAETNQGAAYVFSGTSTGADTASPAALANPEPLMMARFGNSVASAGDVNGDGFDDLVVGAYLHARVHVYLGGPTGIGPTPDQTLANPLEPTASAFGWVVAAGGDLNGDGFDDLVVGAQSQDSPTNAEGAVFVYQGAAGGVGTTPILIDSPSRQELGQFGFSVGSGDVDGDGLPDLVVGATSFDGTSINEGIAYLFRGLPSGVETSPTWTLPHPDPALGGEFGRDVAVGDLDGDGLADLLIAAPFSMDGAEEAGSVWVFPGLDGPEPTATPVSRPSTEAFGWFGNVVAYVGDANGDGYGDFAIGAPGIDSPSSNEGLGVMLFGGPSLSDAASSVRIVLPPMPRTGGAFGWSLGATDVDADGFNDLICGEPSFFAAGTGRVLELGGSSTGIGALLGSAIEDPAAEIGSGFGWWVGRAH